MALVQNNLYNSIDKDLSKINQTYFKNNNLKNLDKEDFIHLFTRLIAGIWKVHPFREGNTRTISAFAFLLLRQYGHTFNAELIKENAKYFRNVLVMASLKEYAEYQYLQKILVDSIGEDNVVTSSDKYKKIKDYNVEDYTYVCLL